MRLPSPRTAAICAAASLVFVGPVSAQQEAPLMDITMKPSAIAPNDGTGNVDVRMTISDLSAHAGDDILRHQPGGPRMQKSIGIADLELRDASGPVPLTMQVEEGFRVWRLGRDVEGEASLHYTTQIDNSAGGILSSIPYVDGQGVSGIGSMLLVLPRLDRDYRIGIDWDLSEMPAGARGVTTFSDGDFTLPAGPVSRLDHALFMAGMIKQAPEGEEAFQAVWTGNPKFDLRSAMKWSAKAYHYYSDFFDDPVEPRYRIFLRENPFNPSNGVATIHAFAMGFGKGSTAEKMTTILGHEMTHTWTANDLGKWYTEGNAVYYQARLPWRAGLISSDEYLKDINLTAARYYSNEVRNAPDEDVLPNFWDDLRYNVLSYDRGAMYFAALNGMIMEESGAERSVDDLIRKMVSLSRDDGLNPTEEDWLDLLRGELGENGVALHRGMMSGETLMVPASGAFGPCFRRIKTTVRRYDLGFGGPQLKRHKLVEALRPGSEAAKAGLREGDVLEYSDSTEGTMRHPDRKLDMTVTRGGKSFPLSYLPRGAEVEAYQWERAPGQPDCGR